MNSTSMTASHLANRSPSKAVPRFTQLGKTNSSLINRFKEMYEKPTAVLADWLGVSDRTAKRKLGGHRELSVEEVGKLIRSEQGFEFVTAIMGEAKPEWWRICAPLMDAADIRKMQMAAQRRLVKVLEGALDADTQLRATISRAEALAVHDEEHARPYLDALRAQARPQNRAVAEKTRR